MSETCPRPQPFASFEAWFIELQRLAQAEFGFAARVAASFDPVTWRDYFAEGYSPNAALEDELSYE